MWKLLFLLVVANVFFVTSAKANRKKCRRHEVYDICPAPCPPQVCGINKALIRCAAPPKPGDPDCKPGCRCIDGYVRNKQGRCIREDKCPIDCPKNETLDPCLSSCPPRYCGVNIAAVSCPAIDSDECEPGCRCKDGYLRNTTGYCIREKDCPKKCGKREIYTDCPSLLCRPLDCSEVGYPVACPASESHDSDYCSDGPACVCKEGYVRNSSGKCIPMKDCPSCGGDPNAVSGCGVHCGTRCSNRNDTEPVACIQVCYENACDCRKGYLYDDNTGKCVLPKDCTPTCGKNEVYSNCSNGGCGPWTCSDLGFPTGCVKMDPSNCKPGCICKEYYVRDDNGVCIPRTECPECGGDPNAVAGCGVNCGRLCSNYDQEDVACAAVCYENACDCREGYVFDENTKRCVLPKDCTKPCTRPNEFYDPCPMDCPPQTCESIGKRYTCPKRPTHIEDCRGACRCKDGFYRDANGNCVSKEDCKKCTGPHEFFDCGNACDNECATLGVQNRTNCPIVNIRCNPKCYCADGYARDENNICIPVDECPDSHACGVNERWEQCPYWLCEPQSCDELGFPLHCHAIPDGSDSTCPGPPGCVCEFNYVRDHNGICIPKDECPSCGGDPNAQSGCGLNCGRLCSNYDQGPVACPKICHFNACDCKKEYVFDENIKKCVLPEQCTPVCSRDHEVYSDCINGGCEARNCSQLGKPVPCIKLDPDDCIEGCVCAKGYLRAKDGNCVLKEQCEKPKCGKNERYEECPDNMCAPQTCSELGYPIVCPIYDGDSHPCPGEPGCVCDNDYVRDDKGTCIPRDQCPSCGGDPNAVSGCGKNCGRLCSNYKEKDVICTLECKLNGCDCREKYVFDTNTQKCVLPKDCTPTCGKYEVYDTCANGGCQKRNCSQVGEPTLCIDPIECKGGCVCQVGYLRAKNGSCIPEEQCPQAKCKKPHEVYDRCPRYCPPQICEAIGIAYPCAPPNEDPAFCEGACVCEYGYYRNHIGECISEEDCLKCTGPNEYFSCGSPHDNECSDLDSQSETNIQKKKCTKRCYCYKGYARDDNNICIPIGQCGVSCDGDPNAYPGCGTNCGRRCSDINGTVIVGCPDACILHGCECKEGYYFDDTKNRCVLPQDCEPVCRKNEVYDYCANGGCSKRKCSELSDPPRCKYPDECIGDCVCVEGYLRNEDGLCVPVDECVPKCNGPNEYFACGSPHDVECSDLDSQNETNSRTKKCTKRCYCNRGYARDDNNICIPIGQCGVSCDGDPNAYPGCGTNCGRLCSDINGTIIVGCPDACILHGCECKEGYYFDYTKNRCVLPQDCEPVCRKNEVYDYCANGGCSKRKCSELSDPPRCKYPDECIGDCVCVEGYLRNEDGLCVPVDECVPKCNGPNEYFACGSPHDIECSDLDSQSETNSRTKKCTKRCYCNRGYARDDNNVCIPIGQCGVSCDGDPNAYPGCGTNCGRLCSDINGTIIVGCPDACILHGCECKEGYYFDYTKNRCVLPQDCEPVCRKNEVYDYCANGGCSKRKCSELSDPPRCKYPDECIGDCVCVEGYLRNEDGLCVPVDECVPKCNGPNEYFACGSPHDVECSDLDSQSETNSRTKKCTKRCYCNRGYARDDNNICIPIGQCGVSCDGDPNAYPGCGTNCGRLCSDINGTIIVGCPDACILHGCECKEGYYFDYTKNRCVLPQDCEPVCRKNEVYDYCANGGCSRRKCSELSDPPRCIYPEECIGDCVCVEGYLRNEDGLCVPEDECPPSRCGPNEIYEENPSTVCEPQHCSEVGFPVDCPSEDTPGHHEEPACICKFGYVRDENNVCIPKSECPSCGGDFNATSGCGTNCGRHCRDYGQDSIECLPTCYPNGCECKDNYWYDDNTKKCVLLEDCTSTEICRGAYEVFSPCTPPCPPNTCESLDMAFICQDHPCKPGCICKNGYYRNKIGECITEKECRQCMGPHEYFSCDNACDNVCLTLNEQNHTNCPIINIDCNKMCYCEDGYARNESNICIPIEDCPPSRCGPNEIYEENPSTVCEPQHCSEVGFPVDCPSEDMPGCHEEPACICKFGYVRDENNVCIPKSECPSCGGDFNATAGCGTNCGRHCRDYGQEDIECLPTCYPNGCECKDNYWYDDNTKKCVLLKDCTSN